MIAVVRRRFGGLMGCAGATSLLALALGGASVASDSAASPARTIKSPDGQLTLSIPKGALAKPAKIRIRVLARGKYPKELRKAKLPRGAKVYSLEPDGLRFRKPVTITRRIGLKAARYNLRKGIPAVALISRDAKGRWGLLDRTSITISGTTLTVAAKTRHFSTFVTVEDDRFMARLQPGSVTRSVGESFQAWAIMTLVRGRYDNWDFSGGELNGTGSVSKGVQLGGKGNTGRYGNSYRVRTEFRCKRAGPGTYAIDITIGDRTPAALFIRGVLGAAPIEADAAPVGERSVLTFIGNARCTAPTPPPPPPVPLCTSTASAFSSNELEVTFICREAIGGFDFTPGNNGDINAWLPVTIGCDGKALHSREAVPANTPVLFRVRTNQPFVPTEPGEVAVYQNGEVIGRYTPTPK